jgi:hypothetical protein
MSMDVCVGLAALLGALGAVGLGLWCAVAASCPVHLAWVAPLATVGLLGAAPALFVLRGSLAKLRQQRDTAREERQQQQQVLQEQQQQQQIHPQHQQGGAIGGGFVRPSLLSGGLASSSPVSPSPARGLVVVAHFCGSCSLGMWELALAVVLIEILVDSLLPAAALIAASSIACYLLAEPLSSRLARANRLSSMQGLVVLERVTMLASLFAANDLLRLIPGAGPSLLSLNAASVVVAATAAAAAEGGAGASGGAAPDDARGLSGMLAGLFPAWVVSGDSDSSVTKLFGRDPPRVDLSLGLSLAYIVVMSAAALTLRHARLSLLRRDWSPLVAAGASLSLRLGAAHSAAGVWAAAAGLRRRGSHASASASVALGYHHRLDVVFGGDEEGDEDEHSLAGDERARRTSVDTEDGRFLLAGGSASSAGAGKAPPARPQDRERGRSESVGSAASGAGSVAASAAPSGAGAGAGAGSLAAWHGGLDDLGGAGPTLWPPSVLPRDAQAGQRALRRSLSRAGTLAGVLAPALAGAVMDMNLGSAGRAARVGVASVLIWLALSLCLELLALRAAYYTERLLREGRPSLDSSVDYLFDAGDGASTGSHYRAVGVPGSALPSRGRWAAPPSKSSALRRLFCCCCCGGGCCCRSTWPAAAAEAVVRTAALWGKRWATFARSPFLLASIAYALLAASVLNCSFITLGYLRWAGAPVWVLGLLMGLSQLGWLLAALARKVHRATGSLARTASLSLWVVLACAAPAAVALLVLGTDSRAAALVLMASVVLTGPALRTFSAVHATLLKEWVEEANLAAVLHAQTFLRLLGALSVALMLAMDDDPSAFAGPVCLSAAAAALAVLLFLAWFRAFDSGTPFQVVDEIGQLVLVVRG